MFWGWLACRGQPHFEVFSCHSSSKGGLQHWNTLKIYPFTLCLSISLEVLSNHLFSISETFRGKMVNILASVCAKLFQSCPTLCDLMDCRSPGSSVHGIFQARILRWVAISSFRGSSQTRDQTHIFYVSCIGR